MAEISLTGDQMLTVLETVAANAPLSAAEVARICDINRTVAHRLLNTLAQRGYLRRGPDGYALGSAVLELARSLDRDISTIARPHMQALAERAGETVVLHCMDDDEAMVLEQSSGSRHLVRVQHTPGSRHPLFVGASGWSMLAFQSAKTVARVLKRVQDKQAAMARIAEVQAVGYAVSRDELQQGVHGLAAPIIDAAGHCSASIAILIPGTRADTLTDHVDPLIVTARAIGKAL